MHSKCSDSGTLSPLWAESVFQRPEAQTGSLCLPLASLSGQEAEPTQEVDGGACTRECGRFPFSSG